MGVKLGGQASRVSHTDNGMIWGMLALTSSMEPLGSTSRVLAVRVLTRCAYHHGHVVQSEELLDVIVAQRAAVFQMLAGKHESLLVWRNALLVLNHGLDIINGVAWFNLKGCLVCLGLYKDLYITAQMQHQVNG